MRWLDIYNSPGRLLLIVAVSIFTIEAAVMATINALHDLSLSTEQEILVDSTLLVLLLSPVLYCFFLRPLLIHIKERRAVEDSLRSERDMLETVTRNIGGGLVIISREYKSLWANKILKNIFGEVENLPCYKTYNQREKVCPGCGVKEVFETGRDKVVHEQKGTGIDGKPIWSEIITTPIRDKNGNVTAALELVLPITEKKRAEAALQAERHKFRSIMDSMPDGVYIVNQAYDIEYINPVLESEFGPIGGRKCFDYFHDRSEICPWCKNEAVFAGQSVQWEFYCFKTGKTYELFDTPIRNEDGSISKLEFFHDITTSKLAEKSLQESERQLRNLSSQLLKAQETERKRIAHDLHDELGQSLALIKLQIRSIKGDLRADQQETLGECELVSTQIDTVIETVRRLSCELRPCILEDLGLTIALKRLVDNFIKTHQVDVTFYIEDIDIFVAQEVQIIVYRIIQEALTNIGKHAEAKNASIAIKKMDDLISFVIEDDGKGFDVSGVTMEREGGRGLGLAIMDERARMIGGTFGFWSEKEKGTRINFTIPARQEGRV